MSKIVEKWFWQLFFIRFLYQDLIPNNENTTTRPKILTYTKNIQKTLNDIKISETYSDFDETYSKMFEIS